MSLENAFHFTPEDLAANRAGRISPDQKTYVKRQWRFDIFAPIFLVVLMAFVTMALFASSVVEGIVATIITLAVAAFFAIRARPREDQITPLSVTGPAKLLDTAPEAEGEEHRKYDHGLRINAVEFPISELAYEAIQEGETYTIYYLPKTRTILSVERAV